MSVIAPSSLLLFYVSFFFSIINRASCFAKACVSDKRKEPKVVNRQGHDVPGQKKKY